MRIFVAGATGVIGSRIVPLLLGQGHVVAGLTRRPDAADGLRALGAEPVVCDVYDAAGLTAAVVAFAPDLILHQLTDLPDDAARLADGRDANARVRREGTANLLAAARAAGCPRVIAQSVAWPLPPGPGADAVASLEESVLGVGGVVLRYGQLYGPGTFYPAAPPGHPRIHVDDAARRTVDALEAPAGILVLAETEEG